MIVLTLFLTACVAHEQPPALPHPSERPTIISMVLSVSDWDTLSVVVNGAQEKVRLNGIDCPEKGQAYDKRAKQAASELVYGKTVTLQTYGKDKYGRTIADVLLLDGTNVNHILVEDGWCLWYLKYASGDTVLEGRENEARKGRKGLWADPQPVPPWEWRKRKSR
jgi:endonuclease YncB( thermonuclease family)